MARVSSLSCDSDCGYVMYEEGVHHKVVGGVVIDIPKTTRSRPCCTACCCANSWPCRFATPSSFVIVECKTPPPSLLRLVHWRQNMRQSGLRRRVRCTSLFVWRESHPLDCCFLRSQKANFVVTWALESVVLISLVLPPPHPCSRYRHILQVAANLPPRRRRRRGRAEGVRRPKAG